jgi:hypothetical protein
VNADGELGMPDLRGVRMITFPNALPRAVFEAIEKHSRTPYGYASIAHVDEEPANQLNEMPRWVPN